MWGDPHISVGRRLERPTQCRKRAEGSQPLTLRGEHHGDLSTRVSRAV
jgi:hypothetical protein